MNVDRYKLNPGTFLTFSVAEFHCFIKFQSVKAIKSLSKTHATELSVVLVLRSYTDKFRLSVNYRFRDPLELQKAQGIPGHALNPSDHRAAHTLVPRAVQFVKSAADDGMTLGQHMGIAHCCSYKGEPFCHGPTGDRKTQHLNGSQIEI